MFRINGLGGKKCRLKEPRRGDLNLKFISCVPCGFCYSTFMDNTSPLLFSPSRKRLLRALTAVASVQDDLYSYRRMGNLDQASRKVIKKEHARLEGAFNTIVKTLAKNGKVVLVDVPDYQDED